MLTADDFKEIPEQEEENKLDNLIEEYIYPYFHNGHKSCEVYENLFIQEDIPTAEAIKRLKELGFKTKAGDINGDSVLIVSI